MKRLVMPALALLLLIAPSVRTAVAQDAAQRVVVERGAVDPAVSPDGSRIAVSLLGSLWLVPISGGEAERVTDGLGWDTHPAWSPDGRFLAYAQQLPSGTGLIVRNMETGGARQVYHTEAGIGQIAFAPGGGELFFLLDRSQYDSHLWRIPMSGGQARQLTFTTNWHEWSFALAPDGRSVFFDSGRYGGSDLYTLDLDSLSATRLTDSPLEHEHSVALTPDGATRVWVSRRNGIDRVMVQRGDAAAQELHRSAYDDKQLSVLPDGRTAVLAAGRALHRLDLATGETTPIRFRAAIERPAVLERRADLVITNARLWDGTGAPVRTGMTVEVRAGRIAAVRPGGASPAGVPVIDARGATLLPGLVDNHYHYWTPFAGAELLARGITSIRDPGVDVSRSMSFKDAIAQGLLAGPALYTTGPLIDGPGGYHPRVDVALDDANAAAALVRALKAQGVDALKVYFLLEPDVLAAVVAEARRVGLPVTGHIGVRTSLSEAIDAGIHGFSHVRAWRDFLPAEDQPDGRDESLDSSRDPIARMQADWRTIDPDGAAVGALIERMAGAGVALDPTLAIQRVGDGSRSRFSLEQFEIAQDGYRRMGRFVARATGAGVRLLAGTDNGSLFDELEAYAEFGVPNETILRAATVHGAEWLGQGDEFGTIEPGKRADLLLVDGDPLQNVRALRNIRLVVQRGRIVHRR